MKTVFTGKVFDLLPISNGIIFSYQKDITDENIIVAYKMLSFENGNLTDVAKSVYLLSKFGSNYRALSALCKNYITAKSILLPGGKAFLLEDDGTAQLIDNDATAIWTGEMKYRGFTADDIVLYKSVIWAAYSECNVILRYNLTTMREELRIGGNNSPFDRPTDLFVENNSLIVSNKGSQKLIRLDLDSYTVNDAESFEEPVRCYLNVKENRFALLESGLYII